MEASGTRVFSIFVRLCSSVRPNDALVMSVVRDSSLNEQYVDIKKVIVFTRSVASEYGRSARRLFVEASDFDCMRRRNHSDGMRHRSFALILCNRLVGEDVLLFGSAISPPFAEANRGVGRLFFA